MFSTPVELPRNVLATFRCPRNPCPRSTFEEEPCCTPVLGAGVLFADEISGRKMNGAGPEMRDRLKLGAPAGPRRMFGSCCWS